MPGRDREMFASFIGYLVMTFLLTKGIRFKPINLLNRCVMLAETDEGKAVAEFRRAIEEV